VDDDTVRRCAALILDARLARRPLDRLPVDVRPEDEASAYAVQSALNVELAATGWGPVAGHKIGCTTPVMQAYLGIPNPCAGEVFATTVARGSGRFAASDFTRVGVECEIAVELGRDLVGHGGFSRDVVADAVAAVMASIEIVDDRYVDYPTLGTPTLIADDFFNAGIVLGAPRRDWRALDLTTVGGRMLINGSEVGSGVGGDILGHPLDALSWLAGSMADRGRALRAGEFVTLGSIVATKWVAAGDEVRIEVDGLSDATALFA
jgi:2-oxo-3-hexenedioate decarboxylase/2-keto-4-pentenoate hydratase